MQRNAAWLIAGLLVFGSLTSALGANLVEKVKIDTESAGLQPGMDPGMYVCAAGHLHIRGTVQNLAEVTLGSVKVAGKVFDAQGKVLGTATASTEQPRLAPRAKTEFDLEFPSVTGSRIQQVKRHELRVVDAPIAR